MTNQSQIWEPDRLFNFSSKIPNFDYRLLDVGEMEVRKERDDKGREFVKNIRIGHEDFRPSSRFWTSLNARFGFSSNIFSLFDHHEVFTRISSRYPGEQLRVAINTDDNWLLGASSPSKPYAPADKLQGLMEQHGVSALEYADGIIRTWHSFKRSDGLEIGGDLHNHRFVMDTPIDGYGLPNIYLGLIRQVCTNGVIAMAKVFKTALKLGRGEDDVMFVVDRALDSFDNEEGFSALTDRLRAGTKSWASINEAAKLGSLLQKLVDGQSGVLNQDVMGMFSDCVGDFSETYSLVSVKELSEKRMRLLPCKATVYQLINLATEIATHHTRDVAARRKVHSFVGDLVSQEYDLEGSVDRYPEFQDWFGKN